jgi:hypothetical protein
MGSEDGNLGGLKRVGGGGGRVSHRRCLRGGGLMNGEATSRGGTGKNPSSCKVRGGGPGVADNVDTEEWAQSGRLAGMAAPPGRTTHKDAGKLSAAGQRSRPSKTSVCLLSS